MNIQKAANWFGLVTFIIGILGFLSEAIISSGYLFGIFSINSIYGLVYIITGIVGFFSAEALGASKTFFKVFGVLYLAIAIVEVIGKGAFLGIFPVTVGDIILHIVLAIFALYSGFFFTQNVKMQTM